MRCWCLQSGLCAATEMESSRGGSIRIQHLTAAVTSISPAGGRSRFPKLDECAHFHYEQVELGPFQVCVGLCYHIKVKRSAFNPYPTAFPYGNGMVLHFYQQQESSTTKTVHKVINKGLKTYV